MKERKGISGSTLKIIAIITMLIDHIGAGVLGRLLVVRGMNEAADLNAWIDANSTLVITYQMMRFVGRLAFPIFCFLLIEGFEHTHDVKKYALRLLSFCLISEIPFVLLFNGKILESGYQNVFFTLLLGLLVIAGLHLVEQHFVGTTVGKTILRVGLNAVIILTGCVLALVLKTDYDFKGILAITVLYLFRNRKKAQMWAGVIIFLLMDSLEMFAALSFILIWFYNGTRGRQNKYFFYFFYPAHLLLLWLVCVAMGIAGIPAI